MNNEYKWYIPIKRVQVTNDYCCNLKYPRSIGHCFLDNRSLCGTYVYEPQFEEIHNEDIYKNTEKLCKRCYRKFEFEVSTFVSNSYLVAPDVFRNKYNIKLIKKILDEYNITLAEFSKFLGISNQRLDQLKKIENLKFNRFSKPAQLIDVNIKNIVINIFESPNKIYNKDDIFIKVFFENTDKNNLLILYSKSEKKIAYFLNKLDLK